MPVDPGNLLLIATARGRPLLGAPGCARSPKENGFDWVLMRCSRASKYRARHYRHGGGRGCDGDRHPAAAARGRHHRADPPHRRGRARRRPLDPHGRTEQAAGRDRAPPAGAHCRRGGAGLAGQAGHRRGGSSAQRGGEGACRPAGRGRAQSGLCDGLGTSVRAGIARGAGRGRRRDRPSRRHAAGRCALDRSAHRAFDPDRGALVVVPTFEGKRGNPVLCRGVSFPT